MKNLKEYDNKLLPNDFSVYQKNDNDWIWEFRCLNSEDNYDLTFKTIDDALCHFISVILEAEDARNLEDDDDFEDDV